MFGFIGRIIEEKIAKLRNCILSVIQSEIFKLLESFYHNQSLDFLKNNELIFGYNDIQYLVNKDSEKFELTIDKLYKSAEKQVHLVVTHKKFGCADFLFTIDDFFLSNDKATVTFSYNINSITPSANVDLWGKIKIYGANLAVKFFPETLNKNLFDQKELREGVLATVFENKITIDFLKAIKNSPLEQKKILGYGILDIVHITTINIRDNGFGAKFNTKIPEWFKNICTLLISFLIHRKLYKTQPFPSKLSRYL